MAQAVTTLGRGWGGILRGDKLERYYRRHLGDRTLGQLPTPAYAPIWNIESNRLKYLGPRTYPDLPVARAIPDGDLAAAVLGTGAAERWVLVRRRDRGHLPRASDSRHRAARRRDRSDQRLLPARLRRRGRERLAAPIASVMHIARQVRSCQHVALARENLARLRTSVDVELLEPIPYQKVRATGFYLQFLDNRDWPEFMRAGQIAMVEALRRRHGVWGAAHVPA